MTQTEAHKQTDKIITITDKTAKSTYQQAFNDVKRQFIEEYSKIALSPDMNAQQKLIEANKYGRIQKITEIMVDNLLQTNKNAIKQINSNLKDVYQLNYNVFADELEKEGIEIEKINKTKTNEEVKENENPYNEIAINTATDKANLKRNVNNSLLSSILKASTAVSAFGAIKEVYEKNLVSSARIAETQATRLENLARENACRKAEKIAEEKGLVMIKIWNTVGDDKVRDAHARADGQEAEVDNPFYVGGERLMYPGDFNGSPANIINCRCYLTFRFEKR
jgi:hypothetical protein